MLAVNGHLTGSRGYWYDPLLGLYMSRASNTKYPCQYRLFGTATHLRQYLSATALIWCSRKSISLLLSPIFTALLTVIQLLTKGYLAILRRLSLHSYRIIFLRGRIAHGFDRLMCRHLHFITPHRVAWWSVLDTGGDGDAFTRPHLMIDTWTLD